MSYLSAKELKILVVVMLLGLCGLFGVDVHTPSLPYIARDLHASMGMVQQSVALFLLGEAVSLLFYGPLSDKCGRRPIVIIGLAIAVISSYAAVKATNIEFFLWCRIFQGIGSGVCMGLGRTILADILEGKRFVVVGSYFALVLSLSPLVAPIIGGYLQHAYGWGANFMFLGSLLLLVLLMYIVLCPETHDPHTHDSAPWHTVFHNYGVLVVNPVFAVSVVLAGFALGSVMVYAALSPFILQHMYHLSPVNYGWALGFVGFFGMLGKLLLPWFIHRYKSSANVAFGLWCLFLMGIAMMCYYVFSMVPLWVAVLAPAIVMFGQSFVLPNTAAYALMPHPKMRGAAGALYGSFQLGFGFLATAVVSWTQFPPTAELIATYLVLGSIGLIAFIALIKSGKLEQQQASA